MVFTFETPLYNRNGPKRESKQVETKWYDGMTCSCHSYISRTLKEVISLFAEYLMTRFGGAKSSSLSFALRGEVWKSPGREPKDAESGFKGKQRQTDDFRYRLILRNGWTSMEMGR